MVHCLRARAEPRHRRRRPRRRRGQPEPRSNGWAGRRTDRQGRHGSRPRPVIEPGRTLGDRYRLTQHIATGGMGDVSEADDTVLERAVAVKILRAEHAGDPNFVERFRGEAKHAAALSDPHITSVFDYGEATDNGTTLAYLVMELVPGEPLSAVLARDGAIGVDRTLAVLEQTAE